MQSYRFWFLALRRWSRGSSFSIVARLRAGRPRFDSPAGAMTGFVPFPTAFRRVPGLTQSRIQWVRVASPGGKEAGAWRYSPPSSAEVNVWSYASTPPARLHGIVFRCGTSNFYRPIATDLSVPWMLMFPSFNKYVDISCGVCKMWNN
jgi:hypothetical protein